MSPTLTDDDITRALAEAADSFPASEPGELALEAQTVPWQRRRGVRLLSLAAAVVVAVLLVGSVTNAVPSLRQSQLSDKATRTSAPSESNGYSAGGATATGGTTGGLSAGVQPPSVAGSAGTGVEAVGSPDAARIVQTGSISLVVDDGKVTKTVEALRAVALQVRGYISQSQLQGVGDDPSATVTIRVPVASFEAVMRQIASKGFGAKVVSSDSSGKDVTAEYADTAAQIATLKAARARYLTILNAAKSVAEILSVQQRVDDVQGQIDRLEGSRRVLANQSDLATLTVTVNEKATAALNTEPSSWSKAWHDAGHGFSSGVQSLIAHSGRALLVLIVAVLLLLAGRGGWRLARRRLI
jgi:hypothetical protein